jgi:(S)-ureidoglycine---glyoxylate transaminase
MAVAELALPVRLLAGGGPSTPDPRVLRAMGLPLIGQFDPAFTAVMDEVMDLARRTFLTSNQRCFAVSGLASAGIEALLNSVIEEGDHVAITGGPRFVENTTRVALRCGARVLAVDEIRAAQPKVLVAPLIDNESAVAQDVQGLARLCHANDVKLLVDATLGLAACELRVDDWDIDACVAGVDYAIGAPAGMTLVTYSPSVEQTMRARKQPPRTSYLDLLQLQAYWSPERLNHHTAPTSLVYGLREALRLVLEEGLEARWARHRRTGAALRDGLKALGLEVDGELAFANAHLRSNANEARSKLREDYGVHVSLLEPQTWRLGLLGADALPGNVQRVLAAIEKVLAE